MLQLFGNKSNIFITPYGPFNADTIKAMDTVGIQILSAALVNEERFDGGASISYANGFSGSISRPQYAVHNNNVDNNNTLASSMVVSDSQRPSIVYHLSAMSLFYDDESGKPPDQDSDSTDFCRNEKQYKKIRIFCSCISPTRLCRKR